MATCGPKPVISRSLVRPLADCATQVNMLARSNEPRRSNSHIDRVSIIVCNKYAGKVAYSSYIIILE